MRFHLLAASLLPLVATACVQVPSPIPPAEYTFAPGAPDLTSVSHRAATMLVHGLPKSQLGPILVTTVSSVKDLGRSSTFGRVVSEQMATELTNLGLQVKEARLGQALTVSKAGQYILTDEARKLAEAVKATTVVTGTYGILSDKIFVTVRLIRLSDGMILSSYDFQMPVVSADDNSPTHF